MTDIAAVHRQALDATRTVVAAIPPDAYGRATPCAGWDVRTLLLHVVSGNWWAHELAGGRTIEDVGTELDGDLLGDDPIGAYARSAEAAASAFEAPGALDAPCAVSYGPVPGSVYAGHRFIDVLVHGWDLAVATDQDATLDPALVAACIEVVAPQAAAMRSSGAFGAEVEVPAGVGGQRLLLALLGRAS